MVRDRNRVVWLLIVLMVASPTWVAAQPVPAEQDPATLDLSFVTPDAVIAAVARPGRVLAAPEMEMLPLEVMSAAGMQELGVDPMDIEQVLVIAEPPQMGPPDYSLVVRFSKPYQLAALKLPPDMPLADAQLDGRPYRQPQIPMVPGFYMPDDRTLIVGTDALLKKILANRKNPQEGALSRLMARTDNSADVVVVVILEPLRPLLMPELANMPLPPPFEGAKRLPELIDAAKLDLSLIGSSEVSLVLLSPSDADAEELQGLLTQFMEVGQQIILGEITKNMQGDDPVEKAGLQYAQRITRRVFEMFQPVRSGQKVKIALEGQAGTQTATIGVLVALLLPAVQAAREAARRTQSANNLKQIGLAMHNYHDVHGNFPPRASLDASGAPLLSWRVHILPFLGQQDLYDQFRLDEPWDSDHNSKLIDMMPSVYQNPSGMPSANQADYLVPTGKGSIFEGTKGASFRDITDGTSNTILVLEVDDGASVIWTKPDDLQYDPSDLFEGLGAAHPGGFNVLLADGAVRFISSAVNPDVFLHLLQRADGQRIGDY